MATFPLDLPLANVQAFDWEEHDVNSFNTSPFTGAGEVQEFEGDYWTAVVRYRDLPRPLAQPVLAFASRLRGAKGTLLAPFPGYAVPLGAARDNPSSPSVNGNGQAGSETVLVRNGPVSLQGWLAAGDMIQIGPTSRPHWHRVLDDVDTDSSGAAAIEIWPRVRKDVIDGDLVAFDSPLCLFRLVETRRVSLARPTRHSFDLILREAI